MFSENGLAVLPFAHVLLDFAYGVGKGFVFRVTGKQIQDFIVRQLLTQKICADPYKENDILRRRLELEIEQLFLDPYYAVVELPKAVLDFLFAECRLARP